MENVCLEPEIFEKRLKEQLRQHRKKLNLRQWEVAKSINRTCDTYQRWESTGKHLTDIFSLLKVFRKLEFSTPEIIELLGLPPLTLSDMEAVCPDEDTLKSIREQGIYSYVRKNCGGMDDATLKRLFSVVCAEYLKRC